MKKILLMFICLCSFWTNKADAQITLDLEISPWGAIGEAFYFVQISETETKYVLLDTVNNSFSLLNMDMSPFIEDIAVPEPFLQGATFMQPIYITRTLFDCDSSNIEFAFQSATNTNKSFRILRTDGTILFERDSANGPYCVGSCLGLSDIITPIVNTSDGTKLVLQHFDDNLDGKRHIYVYSLCGKLNNIFDFKRHDKNILDVFPNPTDNSINFKIIPTNNIAKEYELIIFDNYSKEIIKEKIFSQEITHSIDVSSFSTGLYYYSIKANNKIFQNGKFIITK